MFWFNCRNYAVEFTNTYSMDNKEVVEEVRNINFLLEEPSHVLCKHSNGERASPVNLKSSIGS